MIQAKPASRLHLVLQPTPEDVHEPEYAPDAPIVRLTAFRQHERIFGWLRLHADRITDLLSAHAEVELHDVEIEDVETGKTQIADEVLLVRRELIAVAVGEPRGDPARRRPTRSHPIALQAGDYLVGGYFHVPPDADPLADFRDRASMVPLTAAWIEHWSEDRRSCQSTGTIIVNREKVDWVRVVTDDDLIGGLLWPASPDRSRGSSSSALPQPNLA